MQFCSLKIECDKYVRAKASASASSIWRPLLFTLSLGILFAHNWIVDNFWLSFVKDSARTKYTTSDFDKIYLRKRLLSLVFMSRHELISLDNWMWMWSTIATKVLISTLQQWNDWKKDKKENRIGNNLNWNSMRVENWFERWCIFPAAFSPYLFLSGGVSVCFNRSFLRWMSLNVWRHFSLVAISYDIWYHY